MMGTVAFFHGLDITRPASTGLDTVENVFEVEGEEEFSYLGHWVVGLGFLGVKFPKETSRNLTADEEEFCRQKSIIIGGNKIPLMGR